MTNAVALKKRMKGAELLTPKQRVFAEYFVSHYPKGTKKEAALHAGYSEKTCEDKGQLAAAINSEFRLGQSVGLYVDKKEIKVQDLSAMSKDELIKQINELKDEIPNAKTIQLESTETEEKLED